MTYKQFIISFVFVLGFIPSINAQFYQGSVQEYGKNRVQYNGFGWKRHNYKRFKIHYSGNNTNLAVYVARTLYLFLNKAEERLDYKFPEKMEVIVYQSQAKFRQSNLGISNDEITEIGGGSKIVGSKIFVYYPGNYQDFNLIIKSAVYEVLLKHMFYGGNWKSQVKSNLTPPMPFWLEQGLTKYLVESWNADTESKIKDLILTKKINRFNDLKPNEKVYAGHAVWKFIEDNYGKSTIISTLNITRVTKNLERSLNSIIGLDYYHLSQKYIDFYKKKYISEYEFQNEPDGELLKTKYKKESVYYSAKLSPNNKNLVYIENTLGRYKIKLYNLKTKKTKTIFSAEPKMERIQDYSYPVVEWHPSGKALAFFTELKGQVVLFIYSLNDKSLTKKPVKGFDKILSFDYSPSAKKMIVSAVVNGQTDLYLLAIGGGTRQQLTNDIYDDLTPRYINEYKVVFASNRISDTILPNIKTNINYYNTKNDIFVYSLIQSKHVVKYLERITNTPKVNELQPYPTIDGYQFLSNQNGLYNRFTVVKDSSIIGIDTTIHYTYSLRNAPLSNCVTSITEHYISYQNNNLTYIIYQNGKYKIYQNNIKQSDVKYFKNTTYKQAENSKKTKKLNSLNNENDTSYVNNVYYQKTIITIGNEITLSADSLKTDSLKNKKDKFKVPLYSIYKPNFAKDYILSQFDNNFLFPNYQTYNGPGSVYLNPSPNALLKIGASDLFDDYKLLGGIRIPTSIRTGGEQLIMIQNLKNRLDHRLLYYRKKSINPNLFFKGITHDIRYRLSYPFSEVLSLRSTFNLRQDKQVFIPYSDASLNLNSNFSHTIGNNIELVFDNTIPMELNIRRGNRLKIFSELLKGFETKSYTLNIGVDFRFYTRIKRNFIWVNRLAGATSIGSRKLLYYMGGVDNWILRSNPDFNNDVGVDPTQNFGYQTLATPLRGFIQNTRNGNSFALFTSELRLPIFTYFSSYPLKSDVIKHFQIVAFTDIGSAWTGAHPLSSDNYFNTQIINDNPLTISIQNLREPIVGDFGFGARTKIWGYFIRIDLGWGVENFEIQKPKTQISLSLDI